MAETLLEQAKQAADRLFGDASVSRAETRARLEDLAEHVESKLDTLRDDDEDEEEEDDFERDEDDDDSEGDE